VNYKIEDEDDESFKEDAEKELLAKKRGRDLKVEDDDDDDEEFSENDEEIEDEDDEELEDEDDDEEEDNKKKKPVKKNEKEAKPKKEKVVKEKKEKKPKEAKPKKEKVPKEKKEKKPKEPKPKKELLDSTFNLEERYFYQNLSENEWSELSKNIHNYFSNDITPSELLSNPNLKKGSHNILRLKQILDQVYTTIGLNDNSFRKYKILRDYIVSEFFIPKPAVLESHFFPNVNNEVHVVNMLRTCKHTLDIAIFTLTNDRIAAAIQEVFNRGVKVRIIADDECCKMMGSDVWKLAALGIPVKTDDNAHVHMHHKFAVLDNSLVITGSFNWTTQAVKFNQENILFYENKELAVRYTEEYNRLWDSFVISISPAEALKKIEEDDKIKKEWQEKRKKAKEDAKAAK
jgi:hypothetical protein